mmetsp:Transcript_18287/g.49945  ORF Transcript_18287/g.49945 Transcript_18287/m.49945 type:complete len:83 (+) Transcript_18287:2109-2357(+)
MAEEAAGMEAYRRTNVLLLDIVSAGEIRALQKLLVLLPPVQETSANKANCKTEKYIFVGTLLLLGDCFIEGAAFSQMSSLSL